MLFVRQMVCQLCVVGSRLMMLHATVRSCVSTATLLAGPHALGNLVLPGGYLTHLLTYLTYLTLFVL
jgi:hypothetical protein